MHQSTKEEVNMRNVMGKSGAASAVVWGVMTRGTASRKIAGKWIEYTGKTKKNKRTWKEANSPNNQKVSSE